MEKDSVSGGYGVGDVEALLSKFAGVFSDVKPGAVIVLRISKSCGESFTLEKAGEFFEVRPGDYENADLVLTIDRSVFEALQTAKDTGETLRAALGSRQASVEPVADKLTLYRKGYLGAAQKLGLL